MSENRIPDQIFVVAGQPPADDEEYQPRRGDFPIPRVGRPKPVSITHLHGQVNVFLQQLNVILGDTPEKVGGFGLSEIEVSAEIVLEAKGGVKIALLAHGEAGVQVSAGLKFLFKRQ